MNEKELAAAGISLNKKAAAHVLVDCYPVEKQSYVDFDIDYYVAKVSDKGLVFTEDHEDPRGIVGYGADEKEARDDARAQLQECKFSKKQVEYRRVTL